MSKREPHNPLPATWRQGVAPEHTPAPAPQQPQEQGIDAHSVEWGLMMRATAITRQAFGIPQSEMAIRWTERHDTFARRVLEKLRNGEAIPQHWRRSRKDPPPINPDDWIQPRQASR